MKYVHKRAEEQLSSVTVYLKRLFPSALRSRRDNSQHLLFFRDHLGHRLDLESRDLLCLLGFQLDQVGHALLDVQVGRYLHGDQALEVQRYLSLLAFPEAQEVQGHPERQLARDYPFGASGANGSGWARSPILTWPTLEKEPNS
ncbi:hypothetical protein JZ751_027904 [Albula glossodonta]|uniref:Uncharacterized protein n=1 Tax=Albula glossodonta TaxID=121402 RepID=A0A8T2PB51_9TELE|nr:hypothetical protein JZ751_027904 [Albula glossodonta]